MNDSDSARSADTCVVCRKDTTGGRGLMTLHIEGRPVQICCPMCYKIYQENPARYVTGQRIRDATRGFGSESHW